MSIEFLKNHAQVLSEFAAATTARAALNPDDRWLALAARNQQQAASDAMQELAIAHAQEAGELIDLRFIGPTANGSISLDSFIKIADPLTRAWKAAAYRIRHGVAAGRVGKEISDILNLKLAGITGGSTRVLVTGNGAADLTGECLLQSTLQQTFRLLTSQTEDFYDAVDAVGGKAAHLFGEAIREIKNAGLSAEFTWNSPSGEQSWQGGQGEIARIRRLLADVAQPATYEEEISGSVARIADTGKLELRTAEGKVQVRFPLDLTETVQRLSIAKPTTLRVCTTRYRNTINKTDVFKRLLVDISSAD